MPWSAALAERVEGALAQLPVRGVRQRGVFRGRGFLLGRRTALIVWGEALLVKTTAADYPHALVEPGVVPFAPAGARPMGRWVVVPPEALADDPPLATWVERGLRAVR